MVTANSERATAEKQPAGKAVEFNKTSCQILDTKWETHHSCHEGRKPVLPELSTKRQQANAADNLTQ